jgi:hypothetical protein
MRDPELGRRRRGIEARDGGLPAAGGAFGSVRAAATAPAEDDEDGDCYGGADSYAGYGAGGQEVVEDAGGVVWSWDWCCHYGVFIWSFLAFDFLPLFFLLLPTGVFPLLNPHKNRRSRQDKRFVASSYRRNPLKPQTSSNDEAQA